MRVYAWPCPVNRPYNIVVAIDERCSYDFNIVVRHGRAFHDNGSHVLINIHAKHGLYHKCMGESVHALHNPQIINVSVPVEVQIGYHI